MGCYNSSLDDCDDAKEYQGSMNNVKSRWVPGAARTRLQQKRVLTTCFKQRFCLNAVKGGILYNIFIIKCC